MPDPSPDASGVRLSRRAALATLAAVATGAVVGCTSPQDQRRDVAPRPSEPSVDPDVTVAAEALAAQRAMVNLLSATRDRHPRLAAVLAPAVTAHQAHAAMLSKAVPKGSPARRSPSASPSTSPSPSASSSASSSPSSSTSAAGSGSPTTGPRSTTVPRDPERALRRVVAAERDLTTTTKRQAFRAESGAYARLLGSMAAAAAQSAVTLSAATTGGRSS